MIIHTHFAHVIGLPYHDQGAADENEEVFFVRERNNENDRNAILVYGKESVTTIGYVEKNVAQKMAPLLDEKLEGLQVTGIVIGQDNGWRAPMRIEFTYSNEEELARNEMNSYVEEVMGEE